MGPEHEWYEEYARRIEQILACLTRGLHARRRSTWCSPTCWSRARASARASGRSTSARSTASTPQQLPVERAVHRPRPPPPAAGGRGARRARSTRARCWSWTSARRSRSKRVVVVDAQPGRRREIESVPLSGGPPAARRARRTLDELAVTPETVGDDYLRVRVKVDGPMPGVAEQVASCCRTRSTSGSSTTRDARADPGRPPAQAAAPPPSSSPTSTGASTRPHPPPELLRALPRQLRRGGRAVRPLHLDARRLHLLPRDAGRARLRGARPVRDHRPDRRRQVVAHRRARLRALRPGAAGGQASTSS